MIELNEGGITIFIVVASLAVVQSLFGIGLLVFGTPTLLLLGHSFADTLAILLPASLTISLLQVWKRPPIDRMFVGQFVIWCLFPLAIALAMVLTFQLQVGLNLIVGLVLATFVMLRVIPYANNKTRIWISNHQQLCLLIMGIVHGFSNLGGGLLTILAASRYREKERIRALIALCYSFFAFSQLGVLAILSPNVFNWEQLVFAATSAVVFMTIGQRLLEWISAPIFDRLFAAVMAGYAGLLIGRALGYF